MDIVSEQITKTYHGKVQALKGINLTIPLPGSIKRVDSLDISVSAGDITIEKRAPLLYHEGVALMNIPQKRLVRLLFHKAQSNNFVWFDRK